MVSPRVRRPSRGFTLVEVLVTVAIMVTLVAMILPAIQIIRETANKLVCANNLRNLGQAVTRYTGDHRMMYPTGGGDPNILGTPETTPRVLTPSGHPASGLNQDWGWIYQILPHLSEDALWKLRIGGPLQGPDYEADARIAATPIKILFCPSRRSPCVLANGRAPTDYVGNQGSFTAIIRGDPHDTCLNFVAAAGIQNNYRNGIFVKTRFRNRDGTFLPLDALIGPSAVADGLSNTIMAGEKWMDEQYLTNRAPQAGDANGFVDGFFFDTLRSGGDNPKLDGGLGQALYGAFGSAHPRSMNSLFADGSVRAIAYTIPDSYERCPVWSPPLANQGIVPDPPTSLFLYITLFQRLCHRCDGGTVSMKDLDD